MIITAYNPEIDELEQTFLTTTHAAGVSALSVKNNQGFAVDKRILVGGMGQERSEILTTAAPTGNSTVNTTTASLFAHDTDDPLTVLEFDQVLFYKAPTVSGTYGLLATVAVDVDNADNLTLYDDTTGTTTDFYKIRYAHSISGAQSPLSDPIPATGSAAKTAGKVINAVVRDRDEAFSVISMQGYFDIMNEVNDDLITQSKKPYSFLRTSVDLDFVADQNYVTLPADFWKFDRILYNQVLGGATRAFPLTPLPLDRWERRYIGHQSYAAAYMYEVSLDEVDNRLYIGPTPTAIQAGAFTLYYYKTFDEIDSVADIVETPNTLIYEYKMKAEFYRRKSEGDNQYVRLAEFYENKYGMEIVKMQRVNQKDVGTAREIAPYYGRRKLYHL